MHEDQVFEHEGNRFRFRTKLDDAGETPWEREDGHGPVTEAPRRSNYRGYVTKAPSQRRLGEHWLYDFAEAVKIAHREGWGVTPSRLMTERGKNGLVKVTGHWFTDTELQAFKSLWWDDVNEAIREVYAAHRATFPTARAYAAAAAEADFKRLSDWCDDRWCYVGVIVELVDDDGEPMGESESVWGVESDAGEYLEEVARELASEIVARIMKSAAA